MKIQHNSAWLFLHKFSTGGKTPKNICSWFWNSLLGICFCITSIYGFIRSLVLKDYDMKYSLAGGMFQVIIIFLSAGFYKPEEGVYLFTAILYSIFTLILSVGTVFTLILLIDNVKKGNKNNPIKQSIQDFKEKHCTIIEIKQKKD